MTADELASIRHEARREIEAERRRQLVEQEKARLRAERWWHKLFPFHITITRRK